MENPLCYQIIIPEEWYLNFSKHQLFDEISEHMKRLRKEDKAFDGSQLKIGGTKTTIQINHLDFCWCFIREGDIIPNPVNYFFSGDLIAEVFPHFIEKYNLHQKRRMLEKETQNLMEFETSFAEDDDGIDMYDQKEYLVDTEELLQYEIIFPKALFNTSNIDQMMDYLYYKIDQIFEDGENIQFAVLTVGDQNIILKISNEKLYWWFSLPHHETPNAEEYIFTGNLLENHFPELIKYNESKMKK